MKPSLNLLLILILISCKKQINSPRIVQSLPPVTGCTLPATNDKAWYAIKSRAPIIPGLGDLHFEITTTSDSAQIFFDQGLRLSYAFNHAEAARSFYYASQLDSTCAMCHWGFAYVLGPNYNAGMEPDSYQRAYMAIETAKKYVNEKNSKEKDLIIALATRYTAEPVENRAPLDSTYSAEMKKLFEKYPTDPEIAVLYAESIMDLHPWDLWDKKGNPKSWTPAIISTLESIMKLYPDHPGLHHFYIHAVEASYSPERGIASAKKFDDGLVPNSGHLVHMPSHIYIRTGDYHLGSIANIKAAEIDSQYITTCHAQGTYPLAYYPHNNHFLSATATMEGNQKLALSAAYKVRNYISTVLMQEPAWSTLQHYYTIPFFILIKFGSWNQILNTAEPSTLIYPQAIFHYARGMAHIGLHQLDSAQSELNKLAALSKDSTLHQMNIWGINKMSDIVSIASFMLDAKIHQHNKDYTESIALFKKAIVMEDALNYQEPPDWFFSIRHELGDALISATKYQDAIKTYNEDLAWWPKNGWALSGLTKVYTLTNNTTALATMKQQLGDVWKYADTELDGSRVK
jgi:tetratricopeptide (TPR) repeat protein